MERVVSDHQCCVWCDGIRTSTEWTGFGHRQRRGDGHQAVPSKWNLYIFAWTQRIEEMSENPLFSVIMPAYRMGPYIGAALRSVAAQSYTAWEVLVVDDHAPDDGTARTVLEFAKTRPDHRIEYIRHPHNMGVSAARNTAMAAAKGRYFAFLDPDDVWAPWHLESTLKKFQDLAGVEVVTGPVVRFQDPPGKVFRKELALPDWKVDLFPYSLAIHNFLQPSATVLVCTAIQEVGGFTTDPQLQHIEDYELWVRLAKAGKRFSFHRKPTSGYRKHPEAASSDQERMSALDLRLRELHKGFFQAGQARMIWSAYDQLDQGRSGYMGRLIRAFHERWNIPKYEWLDHDRR